LRKLNYLEANWSTYTSNTADMTKFCEKVLLTFLLVLQGTRGDPLLERDKNLHDYGLLQLEHEQILVDNDNFETKTVLKHVQDGAVEGVKVILDFDGEDEDGPFLRHGKSHKKSKSKSKKKSKGKHSRKNTDTGSRSNPNCDSASSSGSLDLSDSSDQIACSEHMDDDELPNTDDESVDMESVDMPNDEPPSTPTPPAPTEPATPVTPTPPAPTPPSLVNDPPAPPSPFEDVPTVAPTKGVAATIVPTVVASDVPSIMPSTSAPTVVPSTSPPTISSPPTTSSPPSLSPTSSSAPSMVVSEIPTSLPSNILSSSPSAASEQPSSDPTNAPAVASCPTTAFINEFHYANRFVDATEFVEVAHTADFSLVGHILAFYDGSSGTVYKQTNDLSSVLGLTNAIDGFVFASFTVYEPLNPVIDTNGGIALIGPGNTVLDFISYGIQITATDGPAAGSTSTLIGQTEDANGPLQNSLQLGGSGSLVTDFTWQPSQLATPASVNTGQQIVCPQARSGALGVESKRTVDELVKHAQAVRVVPNN